MKQLTKNLSNESEKGRCLTKTLFNELKEGTLNGLLEYVKNDDTLDMEFRGDYLTIYYRGGELLVVKEKKTKYSWGKLNKKYIPSEYNGGNGLKNKPNQFEDYIPEAKHLIDYYIRHGKKNHLGEKEIQQLIVKENNYSPNSNDTDYFIVDMEYEESGNIEGGRFDLIALRWDSTVFARKKDEVSLAIIEVKQGINSIRTSEESSGLRKHQMDFDAFIEKKKNENKLEAFCNDMIKIFKQKCELGLIRANKKIESIETSSKLKPNYDSIEFICILANYKEKSDALDNELHEMKECKFITSSFMGYGLFANNIVTLPKKK